MEVLDARRGGAARLSPLFNYWTSRPLKSSLTNVSIATSLAAASKYGVCKLTAHDVPFTNEGALEQPAALAFTDALGQKLVRHAPRRTRPTSRAQYFRLANPKASEAFRDVLRAGAPLVIAFYMAGDYERLTEGRPYIDAGAAAGELHCVAVTGFDDNALGRSLGALRIKDSRGASFAADGCWWFPYTALDSERIYAAWALSQVTYDY